MDPLQCSCLENPRDRGAWWAAVYGVTQSRTQLKRLSSSSRSSSWSRGLWNFPGGASGKESFCNTSDTSSIPASERSPGGGNGNPLYYSCLKSPLGRGAWQATIHEVWGHKELDIIEWLSMHIASSWGLQKAEQVRKPWSWCFIDFKWD